VATFQEAGRVPSLKEVSKMWHRGMHIAEAHPFKNTLGNPSGPELVLGFNLFRVSRTKAGVNVIELRKLL